MMQREKIQHMMALSEQLHALVEECQKFTGMSATGAKNATTQHRVMREMVIGVEDAAKAAGDAAVVSVRPVLDWARLCMDAAGRVVLQLHTIVEELSLPEVDSTVEF